MAYSFSSQLPEGYDSHFNSGSTNQMLTVSTNIQEPLVAMKIQQPAFANIQQPMATNIQQQPVATNIQEHTAATHIQQQPVATNIQQNTAATNIHQPAVANIQAPPTGTSGCKETTAGRYYYITFEGNNSKRWDGKLFRY